MHSRSHLPQSGRTSQHNSAAATPQRNPHLQSNNFLPGSPSELERDQNLQFLARNDSSNNISRESSNVSPPVVSRKPHIRGKLSVDTNFSNNNLLSPEGQLCCLC